MVARNVARLCSEAPKLDYIPIVEKQGTLPWKKHKEPEREIAYSRGLDGEKSANKGLALNRLILPVVVSALAVYSAVIWIFAGKVARMSPPVALVA